MKIAFFTDCYLDLTGGITSSISAQKAALEHDGHEVFIFSTGFSRSVSELKPLADNHIYMVPSCKLFFRGLTPVSRRPKIIERWLEKTFPELKTFDIIYVHYEAGCSIAGLKFAKKHHIPTVQVMHGREDVGESSIIPKGFRTIVATLLNGLHGKFIPHKTAIHKDDYLANTLAKAKMWTLMVNHANFADFVITPSEHFRKKLMHYGVEPEIKVVPNGFLDQRFPKNPKVKKLPSREEMKIIWHSRVSGEKRIMPFLEALTQVKDKYQLDVYGGGGDYFRAKRYARQRNLNVVFHGNAEFERVQELILRSHLDVLVSYNFDTFGMTLIEAEACGVPVFFCDPDMKEIVPKGSFILSKSESPTDMAAALNNLLDHPEKIEQMSKVMLEHRQEVLISNRIKILEKIFEQLLNG